jgi:multiple sugar transport system substrate-binding protein
MSNDAFSEKLLTLVAANNAPDLLQQGGSYPDYVAKNALLELDTYVGNALDLSNFDRDVLEIGSMNGHLYGVCLGTNMLALIYNKTMLRNAGVPLPPENMTWDQLRDYCRSIAPKLPAGTFPMTDNGNNQTNYLSFFMRQKGTPVWHNNQSLMTAADAQEWIELWDGFRKDRLVPDIQTSATYNEESVNSSALIARKSAIALYWSNQFGSYQGAITDELDLMQLPTGRNSGLWVQPSQYIAVAKQSRSPGQAVRFVNFFVNNTEAGKILGNDRGISSSSVVRNAISAQATVIDQKVYDYYAIATRRTTPMDPNLPNDREFINELNRLVQTVAFGQMTVQQGGREVYDLVQRLKDKR